MWSMWSHVYEEMLSHVVSRLWGLQVSFILSVHWPMHRLHPGMHMDDNTLARANHDVPSALFLWQTERRKHEQLLPFGTWHTWR